MKKYGHVMIDIETLNTTPDSVILSIGVAAVDIEHDGGVDVGIHIGVNATQQIVMGRTTSQSTLAWWRDQTPSAQKDAFSGLALLPEALEELNNYIDARCDEGFEVWAKGTDFDIAILSHAYRSFGGTPRWRYNKARDTRTINALHDLLIPEEYRAPTGRAVSHNALDDAQNQIDQLRQEVVAIRWRTAAGAEAANEL